MAGHHDPRLLYSIAGIKAYHLQNGEESALNPSGPQMLSLLMVPTNTPASSAGDPPEEDFYLHLNLPPELDLALPATTQIYHQPPRSYLIPRWDLGPDSGAFTRIEFPPIGQGHDAVTQEDVDTFETILAQCTAFLERAQAPVTGKGAPTYNPADYAPGEGYAIGTGGGKHGQIVLIDEENGSVVGELTDNVDMMEDSKVRPGEKGMLRTLWSIVCYIFNMVTDPVEIKMSSDGKRIEVVPISDDYLRLANHPAYRDSSIVQNAAAASRLIVTGTGYISNLMVSNAEKFTKNTQPTAKPLTFTPTTHNRVRKINNVTQSAATLSSKTVGQATKFAQNLGARVAGRGERKGKDDNYKPGLLNKSMIAFSTVMDGVATSGKHLLNSSGAAATTVMGHRYGPDAGAITAELAGGVKNVGLVYIDVTGVSRRAIIKATAKGMVS
jgi:spartin